MAAFHFIRAPGLQRAGGGATLTGLTGALRAAGHDVTFGVDGAGPGGCIVVIDGLALPHLDPALADGAVGLVHHTTALAAPDDKAAIQESERALLPRLRLVVAASEAMAARLRNGFGVAPERVVVIPPGLAEVPRSAGSGGPGCAILSVGALVPRKGHAVLLHALARLMDLDWSLSIAGETARDTGYAAAVREQAAGLAGRVRLLGEVDDLEPAWHGADMFALATLWEGHAASTAEALRHGLPVATTSGGAAAAGLEPGTSVVAEPGDVTELSKAMRRMIFDRALRADMAEAAWRAGQALPSWAAQAAKFVAAVA